MPTSAIKPQGYERRETNGLAAAVWRRSIFAAGGEDRERACSEGSLSSHVTRHTALGRRLQSRASSILHNPEASRLPGRLYKSPSLRRGRMN